MAPRRSVRERQEGELEAPEIHLAYISPISPLYLPYISKVSSKRLSVRKDHAFRFRVRCRNSVGESETSAPLEVRSKRLPPLPTEVRQHVPRSWLG